MTTQCPDLVGLNVGGVIYMTSRSTLTRDPDSMLAAMFGGDIPSTRDSSGNYFIDRDGKLFIYVLNFLRSAQLNLPEGINEIPQLRDEADFYQIKALIEEIDKRNDLLPVTLNVGGVMYTTSRSTLTSDPDSKLAAMLKDDGVTAIRDWNGNYFFDRDGKLFRYILGPLRNQRYKLPDDSEELINLRDEAVFYNIKDLIEHIEVSALWRGILVDKPESGIFVEFERMYTTNIGTSYRVKADHRGAFSLPPLNELGPPCYSKSDDCYYSSRNCAYADGEMLPKMQHCGWMGPFAIGQRWFFLNSKRA